MCDFNFLNNGSCCGDSQFVDVNHRDSCGRCEPQNANFEVGRRGSRGARGPAGPAGPAGEIGATGQRVLRENRARHILP